MSQVYGKIFSNNPLSTTHLKILDLVGQKKEVLELGCSTGYLTKKLKENNCVVDVLEIDPDDLKKAKEFARSAFLGDLDNEEVFKTLTKKYDVIISSDVLEHLKNPDKVLKKFKSNLKANGRILISMPNIACWSMRRELFFKGNFEYQESGILDKTHLRFFTFNTIQKLIKQSGYNNFKMIPVELQYPFREAILKVVYFGKRIDRVLREFLEKNHPNFAVYHFMVEVKNG